MLPLQSPKHVPKARPFFINGWPASDSFNLFFTCSSGTAFNLSQFMATIEPNCSLKINSEANAP